MRDATKLIGDFAAQARTFDHALAPPSNGLLQCIVRPDPTEVCLSPLLDYDGSTACGYHQHAIALAKYLVVKVDANNGIRTH